MNCLIEIGRALVVGAFGALVVREALDSIRWEAKKEKQRIEAAARRAEFERWLRDEMRAEANEIAAARAKLPKPMDRNVEVEFHADGVRAVVMRTEREIESARRFNEFMSNHHMNSAKKPVNFVQNRRCGNWKRSVRKESICVF